MMWMFRRALKVPLVAKSAAHNLLRPATAYGLPATDCYFLLYHRVYGDLALELDLRPDVFQRHIKWLADHRRVIAYDDALALLDIRQPQSSEGAASFQPSQISAQPAVVLTFDDGYLDFYTRVFPILVAYGLPAILFVTTGFVEDGIPYPMVSNPDTVVRPVTWDMLGEMHESGLVSIGAHTHTHPILTELSDDQVADELGRPIECFQRRLGFQPKHFAYPRARCSTTVRQQVSQYYSSAVVGGGRPATSICFDRYRIPRVPVRRSDGWRFFRAKMRGWLMEEEATYERLRRVAVWRKK